jgi:hypothetical protein
VLRLFLDSRKMVILVTSVEDSWVTVLSICNWSICLWFKREWGLISHATRLRQPEWSDDRITAALFIWDVVMVSTGGGKIGVDVTE